jgi:hypothetical protein
VGNFSEQVWGDSHERRHYLREAIAAVQVSLQAAFEVAARDQVAPSSPTLAAPASTRPPSSTAVRHTGAAPEIVAYATWAQRLLEAWRETENERLARKFLRPLGGASPRHLPPDWTAKWDGGVDGT